MATVTSGDTATRSPIASLMKNNNVLGFLFMLPAAIFLVCFLTYPLGLGESQQRTAAAQAEGRFDTEIVPATVAMSVKDKETGEVSQKEITLSKDEGNRPDTTLEGLASLQPVLGPGILNE